MKQVVDLLRQLALVTSRPDTARNMRAAADAAPDDPTLRMNLARALAGSGEDEAALEACLDVVRLDRKGLEKRPGK